LGNPAALVELATFVIVPAMLLAAFTMELTACPAANPAPNTANNKTGTTNLRTFMLRNPSTYTE
jgi:hypothetical protein